MGPGTSVVDGSAVVSTARVLWTTATEPAMLTLRRWSPISPNPPSLNWAWLMMPLLFVAFKARRRVEKLSRPSPLMSFRGCGPWLSRRGSRLRLCGRRCGGWSRHYLKRCECRDTEREPDVGNRDRPGRRAHALDLDDVVDENQAAVVLDPVPLEVDGRSVQRPELLVRQPAGIGWIQYFRLTNLGRTPVVPAAVVATPVTSGPGEMTAYGNTDRCRATPGDTGADRKRWRPRYPRASSPGDDRKRVMHDLNVAADVDFLPLKPLVAETAGIELPAANQAAIGGRIHERVVSGMRERLGAGPVRGVGKYGLSGPVGFGSFFVTGLPSLAMTGGLFGSASHPLRGGRDEAAGELGNWIPCTVIKPCPLLLGCTASVLCTAVTLPLTWTFFHWSPTSPKPPSLNCAPTSRPLFVGALS